MQQKQSKLRLRERVKQAVLIYAGFVAGFLIFSGNQHI